MNHFTIIEGLPILDLKSELNTMFSESQIIWPKSCFQICLNHIEENSDDIHFGIGSLMRDWENAKIIGNKLDVPKQKLPYGEEDFKYLCNQFKNTKFEIVYNAINDRYKIGRVRIMMSKPKTCLSWHYDNTKRLHFPIKTQPGCFMAFENEIKHLSQDTWWMTETIDYHTAFNASFEDRIHLVACVIE